MRKIIGTDILIFILVLVPILLFILTCYDTRVHMREKNELMKDPVYSQSIENERYKYIGLYPNISN